MIYIVRHGETDWNIEHRMQGQTDIFLNNIGREQARILSKKIVSFKIDKIISSDLSRAMETAEIIDQLVKVPIVSDKRLREINYGDLEGKIGSPELWNMYKDNPKEFNAESLSDIFARVKNFFNELNINENILIVTHGGILRMLMYYISSPNSFDQTEYLKQYQISIKNAEIFQWNGELYTPIVTLNEVI